MIELSLRIIPNLILKILHLHNKQYKKLYQRINNISPPSFIVLAVLSTIIPREVDKEIILNES